MFKGVIALFKSGIIFDPFVLLGIGLGLTYAFSSDKEVMENLFNSNSLYLLVVMLAFLYNFFIKKVFKEDGISFDYPRFIWNIVKSFAKFMISCVFSILFMMILFAF